MAERPRIQRAPLGPGAALAVRILLTLLLTIGIALIAARLSGLLIGLPAATCVETGCFCEPASGGLPEQLVASLSSLAFVVLGVWAAVSPVPASREHTLVTLAGAAMVFIGAGSLIYHATLTFVGQFLDIFSMYAFGLLLTFGALWRHGRLSGRASWLWFMGLSIALGVVQAMVPDARRVLFALLLLPGIVLELAPRVSGERPTLARSRWLYAGLATMVVAYLIWVLDQSPVLCGPDGFEYGHSVWHGLGAVAAYFVTRHYRATVHERPEAR